MQSEASSSEKTGHTSQIPVKIIFICALGLITAGCTSAVSCRNIDCTCTRYFYGEVVNCSDKGFDRMPTVTSQIRRTSILDFSWNDLTVLLDGELGQFRYMKKVIFSSNHLDHISPGVFNLSILELSPLQHIDFSDNHLNEVPPCFHQQNPSTTRLDNVTYLSLSRNEIGPTVHEYAFGGLRDLEHLDLSGNKIRSLEPRTLRYLRNIKYLDLRNNLIESISSALFARLAQLETFLLTGNKISAIPSGIPTSLRYFELGENRIKNITTEDADNLRSLPHVERLNLSRNGLAEIVPDAFSAMTKLEILDLSYNDLHYLQSDTFSRTESLKYLFLNRNPYLESLPSNIFVNLKKLRFLFLYGCSLNTLEIGPPSISPLSPSFTSSVTSDTVAVDPSYAPNLEAIWLFGNPITCDCKILPLVWFINVRNLTLDPNLDLFSQDTTVTDYLRKDGEAYTGHEQPFGTFCASPFNRHNAVVKKELLKVPEWHLICPHQPFFIAVSMFLGITLFAAAIPVVFFVVFIYLCTMKFLRKKCGIFTSSEDED